MEFGVQPIQSGLRVFDFAAPLVVRAFAQARAAKIEAQRRIAQPIQRLHRRKHHLVVHGAAVQRMWMADQRRPSRLRFATVQQRFQLARRPRNEQ